MRISYKDAAYIQNMKNKKNIRYMRLFNWDLNICEANGYLLTGKVKFSTKIFYTPIVIIVGFFYCLWDGGLKEFPSAIHDAFSDPMGAREYPNSWENSRYSRMKEIYEKGLTSK